MTPRFERALELLRTVLSRRMLAVLCLGFASGLPLLLTVTLLQAWMQRAGVSLGDIGLFALVGLPYTLKFFWAPLFDRYRLPLLGRRRGWLAAVQIVLGLTIVALGQTDPVHHPWMVAAVALLVTFFSASQDIVIDAHRREILPDAELGLGSSLYVYGYRAGMLLASGGGLILADHVPFSTVYAVMGLAMAIGLGATLFAPEGVEPAGTPRTLRAAVVEPFMEYFARHDAWLVLLFILLYKLGDSMATTMTTPFYLQLGFSMTDIGAVVKLFGFWALLGGLFVGGLLMLRIGIYRALWVFGILQGASTALFALLAHIGASLPWLAVVISGENFSGGMGTAAYMAFMASLTDRKFTATQYALLSSLMGVPRVILSAPTGYMAGALGWSAFFTVCALIAIPGLLLLLRFRGWLDAEAEGEPVPG